METSLPEKMAGEITLSDTRGQQHVFVVDVFGTKYSVMTLGIWMRPHAKVVGV